jgi:cytochrome b involved in lipid metabolism
MNKKILILIIAIIVVVLLVIFIKPKPSVAPTLTDSTNTNNSINTSYPLSEVAIHNSAKDCWIAISGKVYNVTNFIASGQHNEKILEGCGIDATTLFAAVEKHTGSKAQTQLSKSIIGTLK